MSVTADIDLATREHGSRDQAVRDAFVALVTPGLDRGYRLAGLILGSAPDAEDAVQDALATAWRSFGSLRDRDRFGAWFDRILVNGCRDVARRRKVVRFVPIDAALEPTTEDPFDAVIRRDSILRRLEALDPDERTIVVFHYWADLPLDEVAVRLGIPSGTVRSRLHRALTRMRAAAEELP